MLQPALSLFESEQEHQYFGLFASKIAMEISPYFNPESWTRLMLQACVSELSIRHAAIAIGALGKAYAVAHAVCGPVEGPRLLSDITRRPSNRGMRSPISLDGSFTETMISEAYSHHHQALEQYDKAIKRMRNDISNGNQNMRTTLIICIICICFEAIHGNHISAAGQLQSGLALIQDWKSNQRSSGAHPQGFSSPAPDVVEDFLVQTFGRMEIQSMSVFDRRSTEIHLQLKTEGKDIIEKMPKQFTSIEQARVYLDLITRRLMHFNTSIHKAGQANTPPSSRENTPPGPPGPPPWIKGPAPRPMPFIDGKIPIEHTQSVRSSRELALEQAALNNELGAWREAFRPILSYARSTGGQDAISALAMTISAVASSVSLRSAFSVNESAYDVFIPEFKIIVDYARILLGIQQSQNRLAKMKDGVSEDEFANEFQEPSISFAFELGIVPHLYLVMVKCRDLKLRREALRLLEENPRREGVWDSVATTALGRWVISLEEEGTRRVSISSENSSITDESESDDLFVRPPINSRQNSNHLGLRVPDGNMHRRPSFDSQSSPRTSQDGYEVGARSSFGDRQNSQKMGNSGVYRQMPYSPPIDTWVPIPEEMRVRKAQMRFDLLERRANMMCHHLDLETGIPVQKQAIFTW